MDLVEEVHRSYDGGGGGYYCNNALEQTCQCLQQWCNRTDAGRRDIWGFTDDYPQ